MWLVWLGCHAAVAVSLPLSLLVIAACVSENLLCGFKYYFGMQLAAQWLVISSGNVSLFLQREIGLASFMAAIQTYCLKVSQTFCGFHVTERGPGGPACANSWWKFAYVVPLVGILARTA